MFSIIKTNENYVIGDKNETNGDGFIEGCSAAPENFEIPYHIENKQIKEIGSHAFYGCYKIINLTLSEGFEIIGSFSFCKCYNLTTAIIPKSVTIIRNSAFEDCFNLTNFTILQNSNLIHIGEYSFNQCFNLLTFIIPSSVNNVGTMTFSDIKSSLAIFYYPNKNNYDQTMFQNSPNVIVYAPLNGANIFGSIKTTRINLPYIYIKSLLPKCECIIYNKLVALTSVILTNNQ